MHAETAASHSLSSHLHLNHVSLAQCCRRVPVPTSSCHQPALAPQAAFPGLQGSGLAWGWCWGRDAHAGRQQWEQVTRGTEPASFCVLEQGKP